MIRWPKVRTVAAFEFLSTVKRPGYLVVTFGMPLFLAAYAGIVGLPAYYAAQTRPETQVYGVVDGAGVLALDGDTPAPNDSAEDDEAGEIAAAAAPQAAALLDPSPRVFRPFADEASARRALMDDAIKGYFVVPADYVERGAVDEYGPDKVNLSRGGARSALAALIRQRLVADHLPEPVAVRAVRPVAQTRHLVVTSDGTVRTEGEAASAIRVVVPVAFTILFLMSVLVTSGYLLQGTAVEKENKVVDVLMASASPDEILAGKLAGLSTAGVLQIAAWLAILSATGVGIVPLMFATQFTIPWRALALALPLFLVAFLFFGSLMIGTGSLGSNMRESQQLAMVWSLTAALPLMLLGVLLSAPHGMAARVMTWIPFTAGPVVVMRAALDPAFLAWWEVAGPIAVLLGATWLAIRVGARLFRIGLLSAGSRPSLAEVLRQARLQ